MRSLFPLALAFALASGGAGLAHQILWTRRLVDVLGASADTFSKVVGAFFLGLALGAWGGSWSTHSKVDFWRRVGWAELAVGVLAVPILFSTELSEWVHWNASLSPWLKLLLPLLFVMPPAAAMGLVVPWMVRALAASSDFAPKHVVWLYAVNTLGGVVGIGFVVLQALPRLGLTGAGVSAISLNVLVACGAFVLSMRSSRHRGAAELGPGGPAGRESSGSSDHPLTSDRAAADDNRFSALQARWLAFASGFLVLALEVILQHQLAQVTINSFYSSALAVALVLLSLTTAAALVPPFVRWVGDSRRAMNLALFTAVILCAIQPFLLTSVRGGVNILPYELNRNVFQDSRVRFIQEDARWIIGGRRDAYDVVVGDLFLPWRTGEGRLYTREHFQNVRRSLRTGGLFCQWLPMFQLTRPQFEAIARTFHEVFPDAFLLRGDFYTELPILGLVGGCELGKIDWLKAQSSCSRLRSDGKVTDPLVRHVEGVAMMIVGSLPHPSAGPVNTLANAWLEWDAGRNILGLRTPWFMGVPCAEYVRDLHRVGQSVLPPELRAAHDAGQFFLTLEVAAKLDLPVLHELKLQVLERLPSSLQSDDGAQWQQWPMRVKPVPRQNERK